MTIPLDSRRTAKPRQLKAFRSPLTPAISTLARPSLNLRVFYRFPATGGRVPLVLPPLLTVDRRLLAVRESRATSSISFIPPAYEHQPRMSPVSPAYAKTGGVPPPKNVGVPTFLIFRTFLWLATCPPQKAGATQPKRARQASPLQGKTERGSRDAIHVSLVFRQPPLPYPCTGRCLP
jgi:hypothetical protein